MPSRTPVRRAPAKPRRPTPQATRRAVASAPKLRPDRSGPLRAEILCVGHDLLRGELTDQNVRPIARALLERGCAVDRITFVDHDVHAVAAALSEALRRNPHVVVTTGGLGPAPLDRTLDAVAKVLRLPTPLHPMAREQVEQAYRRLQAAGAVESAGLTLAREKLCRVPVGATLVPNPVGLAPGFVCRVTGGAAVVCLPGAGKAVRTMLDEALAVLSDLGSRSRFSRREVEASTADEAALVPMLEQLATEYPEVHVASRPATSGTGKVVITLETSAPTEAQAESHVERAFKRLLALASGSP